MLLRADDLAATGTIAAALARLVRPGDIVVLAGEMGAGKTTFAQAFGAALGVTEPITSPTFTLVHSYRVPGRRITLHHADLYRLDRISELEDLALDELAEFDGVVLVEWGDVAAAGLGDHLSVRLARIDEDDEHVDDDAAEDDPAAAPAAEDASDPADDFGLDEARTIEIEAVGREWAGRWDRVVQAVEAFRC